MTNPSNPARRDVVQLQANSYIVLQWNQDNPGIWPLHCHIAWHLSAGFVWSVLERPDDLVDQMQQIPDIMSQTCDNWNAWSEKHQVSYHHTSSILCLLTIFPFRLTRRILSDLAITYDPLTLRDTTSFRIYILWALYSPVTYFLSCCRDIVTHVLLYPIHYLGYLYFRNSIYFQITSPLVM